MPAFLRIGLVVLSSGLLVGGVMRLWASADSQAATLLLLRSVSPSWAELRGMHEAVAIFEFSIAVAVWKKSCRASALVMLSGSLAITSAFALYHTSPILFVFAPTGVISSKWDNPWLCPLAPVAAAALMIPFFLEREECNE